VTIREMKCDDEGKSLEFFKSLPYEDRQYLRMDVTSLENIRSRMNPGPFQNCFRLVAEKDGEFLADATICGHKVGWQRHVAEIRCIIHPGCQRKGLGKKMLFELFQKVLQTDAEVIFSEVVPEQKSAITVLEKLGFKLSMTRKNHVRDMNGKTTDLLVYTVNVSQMWDNLLHFMHMTDLEYPRS
jgi:RimJ/RimL family protein N-acetyltransferase